MTGYILKHFLDESTEVPPGLGELPKRTRPTLVFIKKAPAVPLPGWSYSRLQGDVKLYSSQSSGP